MPPLKYTERRRRGVQLGVADAGLVDVGELAGGGVDVELLKRERCEHVGLPAWLPRQGAPVSRGAGDSLARPLGAQRHPLPSTRDAHGHQRATTHGAHARARSKIQRRSSCWSEVTQVHPERLRELALALGPKGEVAMSTAAEIWTNEGRARGKAEGVLSVLEARGLAVGQDQRARVLGCSDLAVLDRWLRRAVTAAATDDVFAE